MSKNYEERILSEFANKVLSTDEPFAIKASEDSDLFYFHFIQAKYGSAKLVYRAKYIEKKFIFENANFDDSIKYELYAIAVKGTIYYFDDLLCFRISNKDLLLPDSEVHKSFYDFKSEINSYIKTNLFPEFYNALVVDTKNYRSFISDARNELIFGKKKEENFKNASDNEVIAFLCGFIKEINDLGNNVLSQYKDLYSEIKEKELCVKKCIEKGIAAQDWKIEMARAVRKSGAKFLTVEFELNGKTANGKVECCTILNELYNSAFFHEYDFDTSSHGQDIIDSLDCSTRFYDDNSKHLYCKNIIKISYRGKTIFERKKCNER